MRATRSCQGPLTCLAVVVRARPDGRHSSPSFRAINHSGPSLGPNRGGPAAGLSSCERPETAQPIWLALAGVGGPSRRFSVSSWCLTGATPFHLSPSLPPSNPPPSLPPSRSVPTSRLSLSYLLPTLRPLRPPHPILCSKHFPHSIPAFFPSVLPRSVGVSPSIVVPRSVSPRPAPLSPPPPPFLAFFSFHLLSPLTHTSLHCFLRSDSRRHSLRQASQLLQVCPPFRVLPPCHGGPVQAHPCSVILVPSLQSGLYLLFCQFCPFSSLGSVPSLLSYPSFSPRLSAIPNPTPPGSAEALLLVLANGSASHHSDACTDRSQSVSPLESKTAAIPNPTRDWKPNIGLVFESKTAQPPTPHRCSPRHALALARRRPHRQ